MSMALNVLSFSVRRVQDSVYGLTTLQPSWADQPWPYKFSVSPIPVMVLTRQRELNPVPEFLEGGWRLGSRRECTMEARHNRR
jgi:hypothetical protein